MSETSAGPTASQVIPVVEETKEEKHRRLNRECQKKRRLRAKLEAAKNIKLPNKRNLNKNWAKNTELLANADPKLLEQYRKRHADVMFFTDELELIKIGMRENLPAAPKDALEFDLETMMPRPDENFRVINADVTQYGDANYSSIEADICLGNPLDEVGEVYRAFGFRLRFEHYDLRDSREALVLYGLQSGDESVDKEILETAIAQWTGDHDCFDNEKIIWPLIRKYKHLPEPKPSFITMRASDGYEQRVPYSIYEDYQRTGIPFKSPAQLKTESGLRIASDALSRGGCR